MLPDTDLDELQLRDYLEVLRRRWLLVSIVTAAVAGAAFLWSSAQTPLYAASAELLIQQRPLSSGLGDSDPRYLSEYRTIANELELLNSQLVRDRVAQDLGATPDLSASAAGDADLLRLRAQSTEPEEAARAANTYAESYVNLRKELAVDDYFETSQVVQRYIDELDADLVALDGANTDEAATDRALLESRRSLYGQQLDSLGLNADLAAQGTARIISKATAPDAPFYPQPARNLIMGFVVGMILGTGIAFLLEYLDDTVKDKALLERLAGGKAVLGFVPKLPKRDRGRNLLVVHRAPSSPAAESYRTLRTSIQFVGVKQPVRTVMFTSSVAGEGKTTTATNMAVTMAQAGQRVALLDCDLRNPSVHKHLGIRNDVGLTTVLLGQVTLDEAVRDVVDIPGMVALTAGEIPPNPSELLGSQRTSEIVTRFVNDGYVVLIDTPPVLPVTDALVLSYVVDGVVMVVGAGTTKRAHVEFGFESLARVDAPVIGSVLNGVSSESSRYGYGYGYRYGQIPAPTAGTRSGRGLFSGRRRAAERTALPWDGEEIITDTDIDRPGAAQRPGYPDTTADVQGIQPRVAPVDDHEQTVPFDGASRSTR